MLLHVYGQFVKQVKDFRSSLSILSSQACSGLSVELFKHRHYSMYIFFFLFFQYVEICNICLPLLSCTSIHSVQRGSVAHPASRSMNTGLSFPGGKRPGSAVNYLPLSSDKVENKWSHTSTLLHPDIHTCIRTQLHSNS